jgi:malonate decarboxylase delta subunit
MEKLEFWFAGSAQQQSPFGSVTLVGVVGSGNLEVMIERVDLGGKCLTVVDTSVRGFADTWKRVLEDFFRRHSLSDIRVSINDGGATPAVVSLRLDQAYADLGGRPA